MSDLREARLFASNLERVLATSLAGSDIAPTDHADIAARFESLRGYGRLPQGRENRSTRLTAPEIASAILGLVPLRSAWAGHAAIVLADLRPAGGAAASFEEAPTLSAAIERLLEIRVFRRKLVSLECSVAEAGVNSNGSAVLTYEDDGNRKRAFFISKMAVSRLQPGGEASSDADRSYAPVSRSMAFNQAFFHDIAVAIERAAASTDPPAGDGSEYDAEEARQARYKALGVGPLSRFLNIGVDTQVTWPKAERLVSFDQYRLVMMPKTKEHTQSVHVDLTANRLTHEEALTVIHRFLSVLSWCDDQFAVTRGGWSGNPIPVAVHKRDLAFSTAYDWVFDRRIPPSDESRRALAHYREGRNAEDAALVSYAVLSYFKIVELRNDDGPKAKRWIKQNFAAATSDANDQERINSFLAECGQLLPEDYIYGSCRLAVAHASVKTPSDSDDLAEIRRLGSASYILRLLSRRFIASDLGISESYFSGT